MSCRNCDSVAALQRLPARRGRLLTKAAETQGRPEPWTLLWTGGLLARVTFLFLSARRPGT